MVFHPNKCKVLVVTNKYLQYILPFDRFPYCLDGTYIDYVSSEKDLGVLITSKLNWGVHSDALVTKASSRLGLLRRTCHFTKSSDRRRVLYLALIRSIFEHCSVVWHPHTTSHLVRLDAIQRRAVKWILKEQYQSYQDSEFLMKQQNLNLLPIGYKLKLTDLVLFHKIVYKTVQIAMPNYIFQLTKDSVPNTRKNAEIYNGSDDLVFGCAVRPRVDAFRYSFFPRTVSLWNVIPLQIRQTECNNKFTVLLKEHFWTLLIGKPD